MICISERVKERGLRSVKEMAEILNVSPQSLHRWAREEPKLFATALDGAVFLKYFGYRTEAATCRNATLMSEVTLARDTDQTPRLVRQWRNNNERLYFALCIGWRLA